MYSYDLDGIQIVSANLTEIGDFLHNSLVNSGKSKLIITFNLEFYRNALINKNFYTVCRDADLVVPDGAGIVHLIKLKYKKGLYRITGNDLFEIIMKMCQEYPLRIAFVGSVTTVLEKLKTKIHSDYPKCQIVAAISPSNYFENNEVENEEVLQKLINCKPDVLFLALGNPRQEMWLYKYKDQIGSKLNIGVGAVFDFYTGYKKRSPILFQKLSLEWAWRLIQEPKRLSKRYLVHGFPFFIIKSIQIMFKNDIKA